MNRRAVAAELTWTDRGKLDPPFTESATIMFSFPAPVEAAQATYTCLASRSSTATVGLLKMLPSLQRSSPGTGQVTFATVVATVPGIPATGTGKPACGVRPLSHVLNLCSWIMMFDNPL